MQRLRRHGTGAVIIVNGIAPDWKSSNAPPGGARTCGGHPADTGPAPEDVAAALIFLLTQSAVTGQVIFVDGGQHLRG